MDTTHNYIQYKDEAASTRFIVLIPKNNRKLRCVLGGNGLYSCTYDQACAKVWPEATLVINSTPTTFTNIRIPSYDQFNSCGDRSLIGYHVKDFYYFWTSTKINSTSAYVYQISSNTYIYGAIDGSRTYSAIPMIVYQVHQ